MENKTFTLAVLSARMSADPAYADQSERIILSAELIRGLAWVCAERFATMTEAIYKTFADSPICPPEGREYWSDYADRVEKSNVDPWRLGTNYEEWWSYRVNDRWIEQTHFLVADQTVYVCPNQYGRNAEEITKSRKTAGAIGWHISNGLPSEPKTSFVFSRPFQLARDKFGRIVFI